MTRQTFARCVLSLALGLGLGAPPAMAQATVRVGQAAPAFRLARLDDAKRHFTPSAMRGQVWVLNVWASWCVPCREELPALKAVSAHATVVGLNYRDTRQRGVDWLARHGDPFHATAHDIDGEVGLAYGVVGVPETFVIDPRGIVRLRHSGAVTDAFVRDELLPLIQRLQRG